MKQILKRILNVYFFTTAFTFTIPSCRKKSSKLTLAPTFKSCFTSISMMWKPPGLNSILSRAGTTTKSTSFIPTIPLFLNVSWSIAISVKSAFTSYNVSGISELFTILKYAALVIPLRRTNIGILNLDPVLRTGDPEVPALKWNIKTLNLFFVSRYSSSVLFFYSNDFMSLQFVQSRVGFRYILRELFPFDQSERTCRCE